MRWRVRGAIVVAGGAALASTSGACGAFTTSNETPVQSESDAASSADAGAEAAPADGGVSAPLLLAKDLVEPRGIAMDDANVYFTAYGEGTIRAVAKDGTSASVVASAHPEVRDVVVDGARLYWLAKGKNGGCAGGNRAVYSARKDGASPTKLIDDCQNNVRLTQDALSLYYTTTEQQLWQLAKDGSSKIALTTAEKPGAVATSGALVVWASASTGKLTSYDRAGGGTAVLAMAQPGPQDIVVEGSVVYWINEGGSLVKLELGKPDAPAVMTSGLATPARLASDGTRLYWTNAGDGTVASMAKAGGAVTVIATGQAAPFAIAADAKSVAWTNLGDGTVRIVRR
jgi:hypothetical protein